MDQSSHEVYAKDNDIHVAACVVSIAHTYTLLYLTLHIKSSRWYVCVPGGGGKINSLLCAAADDKFMTLFCARSSVMLSSESWLQ
eukprot:scaffold308804_cov41-Prasinocladus_malaysianus.AAC.1